MSSTKNFLSMLPKSILTGQRYMRSRKQHFIVCVWSLRKNYSNWQRSAPYGSFTVYVWTSSRYSMEGKYVIIASFQRTNVCFKKADKQTPGNDRSVRKEGSLLFLLSVKCQEFQRISSKCEKRSILFPLPFHSGIIACCMVWHQFYFFVFEWVRKDCL